MQSALANVVTQEDLNEEFDNLLVTIQQLIENQEPTIVECATFIQLPGGQVYAELKPGSETRMLIGDPIDHGQVAGAQTGSVKDVCIVPPNAAQQIDFP
ncbi:MAG TPA: hypothetical protein VFP49_04650 [Nitrososphaeraceae archaeon]|nr:hypothetical protein [Nitrososphaeraceae archaeon]